MADRRGSSRRKDSKQMWEESERPRPARDPRDSRPSRDPRDDRDRDDRRRSYRSRSRERERGGGGSSRHRGEGRDRERERAGGSNRTSGHRDAERFGASQGASNDRYKDDGRTRERRRSRSPAPRRSRSPRPARDSGARGGRDRPVKESGNPQDGTGVMKSTEVHDPNKMEIDKPTHPLSTEPPRYGSTIPHDGTPLPDTLKTTNTVENKYDDDIEVEIDPDLAAMQAMMGFGGFGSTQNKKVAGNNVSAVRKEKKTEYRQYMNRVGGFNRPLSPTRE